MSEIDETDTTRRGFLKTAGAAAAAAAAPAGTLKSLTTPDTAEPDLSGVRQALTDEIKFIYDSAKGGQDQTDHIIDELGDLWDEIEDSGDPVALKAYEIMMDTTDTDAQTQAAAALRAVKMLEKGVMPGAAGVVARAAAPSAAPAATAAVSAFKTLVQRVMSAGQTSTPQTPGTDQIQPATSAPPLPAPDKTAGEIMAQLRDIVGRDLTPQERQVVGQEIEKTKS